MFNRYLKLNKSKRKLFIIHSKSIDFSLPLIIMNDTIIKLIIKPVLGVIRDTILFSPHAPRVTVLCAQLLNHVQPFVTPWTVPCQPPLFMGILQARILEWVSYPFSRGSSLPRN